MEAESRIDLDRWIATFRGPLIGLLASWGSDWRAAEELAQETFAEAWVSRERFNADPGDIEAVGAWLRGIAFRLSCAAARRDRVRASPLLAEPAVEEAPTDERRALLVKAFTELSAAHQTVLRMHYLEATSAREVASLLGLTPKAVESRLYQARKELRALVDRAAKREAQGVRR